MVLYFVQLDFEDDLPDDESGSEESHRDESEEGDDDNFEDAFDNLTLHEDAKPTPVAVCA